MEADDGAVINIVALERISHFNILNTLKQNQQIQGI